MATAEKKSMKAELNVTVFDEMKKATADWVKGFPVVMKETTAVKKQWKVEVDPRKYSAAELKRLLRINIAYDLKTFDVHCAKLKQLHEKGKKSDAQATLDLVKSIKALTKKIADTSSLVIEDIEKGGTDDKKLLAQGKKALRELSKYDFAGYFADQKTSLESDLKHVTAETRNGDAEAVQSAAEYVKERVEDLKDNVGGFSKDADAAIRFLDDVAAKIRKAKDASPELEGFADLIRTAGPAAKLFSKDLSGFLKAIQEAEKAAKGAPDPQKLRTAVGNMAQAAAGKSSGKRASDAYAKLQAEFKKVEKKLK